ncbi:MAG: hypothetical protein K2W95_27620 [Candidatus Obscuribacterales bacterium]|nr:hypothetical protein [Candidatus Obscuribacterales bacterium]
MSPKSLPRVEQGRIHGYFVYDVGETIDLSKLVNAGGKNFVSAQLDLRSMAAPGYIQFQVPPLVSTLADIELAGATVAVRLKIFDYGVVSLRLSVDFSGNFDQYLEATRKVRHSGEFAAAAEKLLPTVLKDLSGALSKPHVPILEDYFIFEINTTAPAITSADWLNEYRKELSALITCETNALSVLEQEESLRVHFSYFENDLVVVQWDSAVVIDTRAFADATAGILEFANTQLVELRTYDARLDAELDEIYKWNVVRTSQHGFSGRKEALKRIEQLRSLVIDVRELTDRSSNALKIIGDAFYARLYRSASSRLGLEDWHKQMESKLTCIDDVYQFAIDQSQHARSEFLEIIIIALITFEIFLSLYRGH